MIFLVNLARLITSLKNNRGLFMLAPTRAGVLGFLRWLFFLMHLLRSSSSTMAFLIFTTTFLSSEAYTKKSTRHSRVISSELNFPDENYAADFLAKIGA